MLAILAAVVFLGVFRVPDENALVAAGIRAEAQAALYQSRHPLSVEVKGRQVTVSGRVETPHAAQDVVARLQALQGVENVRSRLTVLPAVTPFGMTMVKGSEGVRLDGHVPSAALLSDLEAAFATPVELPVATGAPDDDWSVVARAGAVALSHLLDGDVSLVDRALVLTGTAHRPEDMRAAETALQDLPESYSIRQDVEVLDDGLPYALLVTRDTLMGLSVQGKLPPDTDIAVFDGLGPAQKLDVMLAPLPLAPEDFGLVLQMALPVFAEFEAGAMSMAPGVLSLSGGPIPAAIAARVHDLGTRLPDGWRLVLSLVPEDDAAPLQLVAEWDGAEMRLSGKVPAGFDLAVLETALAAPVRATERLRHSTHPDLSGWGDAQVPGLRALIELNEGRYMSGPDGKVVEGIAADPLARRRAQGALSGVGRLDVLLADDGRPPVFTLSYDASVGAQISGKLPRGLSPARMAGAMGLAEVRGAPPVSPQEGAAKLVLTALDAISPWMSEIESLVLAHDASVVSLEATPVPGLAPEALHAALGRALPPAVVLEVGSGPEPLAGTRRLHPVLGVSQVYAAGLWLPEIGVPADALGCNRASEQIPEIPFDPGGFTPAFGSSAALAHLVALARACTRIGGMTAVLEVGASGTGHQALVAQLARRRAEALRQVLIARGVPEGQLRTGPMPGVNGVAVSFVQD